MTESLFFAGKEYISAKRGARESGYTSDYLGQLCRAKKIPSKLVGRTWYVEFDALIEHKNGVHPGKARPTIRYESDDRPTLPALYKEIPDRRLFKTHLLKESFLITLSLVTVISTGMFALERAMPEIGKTIREESLSLSDTLSRTLGIEKIATNPRVNQTALVLKASVLSAATDIATNIIHSFRSAKEFAFRKIFFTSAPVPRTISKLPTTTEPPLLRQGYAGQATSTTPSSLAVTTSNPSLDITTLRSDLKSELEKYVRAQINSATAPQIIYQAGPTYNTTVLRDEILLADTRPTVTRQSDSDSGRVSSVVNALTDGGTFTNSTLTGATVSGPTGSFTNFTFTNATGTSLYLAGNLNVAGNTTTIGQLLSTRVPTLAHVFTTWPLGTSNASDATIYINPASAAADTNIFAAAVAGTVKFLVDAEGDIYGNNLILSGSTSQGATTIAGNLTVQDHTTLGDASSDLVTVTAGLLANASTTIQNLKFTTATGTSATTTNFFSSLFHGNTLSIGGTATTTINSSGDLLAVGSTTLQNFTFTNATGTSATTTNFFATTASSTNLFSSLLTVGGNKLVVDSAGNVGVGTSGPSELLHLSHLTDATLRIESLSNGAVDQTIVFAKDASVSNKWAIGNDGSDNGFHISEGGTLGTNSRLTILPTSGNVGIGTTGPNYKLQVHSTSAQVVSTISTDATENAILLVGSDVDGSSKYANFGVDNSSNILRIGMGSSFESVDDIVVDSSGKVGIGTTNPGGTMGGYSSFTKLDLVGGSTQGWLRIASGVTGEDVAAVWLHPFDLTNAGWMMGTNNDGKLRLAYGIGASEGAAVSNAKDGSTGITIQQDGNVGIGTTGPGAKLHVQYSADTSSTWWTDAVAGMFVDNSHVTGDAVLKLNGTGGTSVGRIVYGNNTASDKLIFSSRESTNTAGEMVAIDNNGNVGIGTTGPTGKLEVVGHSVFQPQTSGAGIEVKDYDTGNGSRGPAIVVGRNTNATLTAAGTIRWTERDGNIHQVWVDNANQLRINEGNGPPSILDTDGTVIGTQTSSLGTKDLVGQFTDNALALDTLINTPLYNFRYKSGAYNNQEFVGIIADYSPTFAMDKNRSFNPITSFGYTVAAIKELNSRVKGLGTTGQGDLTITGNVGIGTTGPGNLLHVLASAAGQTVAKFESNEAGSVSVAIDADADRDAFFSLQEAGTNRWQIYQVGSSGVNQMEIRDQSGVVVMTVENAGTANTLYLKSGNVGIGTASPDAHLDIEGTDVDNANTHLRLTNSGGPQVIEFIPGVPAISNVGFTLRDVTDGANRIVMDGAGQFSLGSSADTSPDGQLDVDINDGETEDAAVCITVNNVFSDEADGTCESSALRFKEDISDITYGLDEILALRPKFYRFKKEFKEDFTLMRAGFIAEEVAAVIPEAAEYEGYDDGVGVGLIDNYDVRGVVSATVAAIQEFYTEFIEFKTTVLAQIESVMAWFVNGKFMVQNDICVDDVCVTKEQFKQMLLNSGVGATQYSSGGSSSSEPSAEESPVEETPTEEPSEPTTIEEETPSEEPSVEEPAPEAEPAPAEVVAEEPPAEELSPEPEPTGEPVATQ